MATDKESLSVATDEQNKAVLAALHQRILEVNKKPLHEGQIQMARAFFVDKKKVVYAQCGRSFGKTETILYLTTRFALTNPGVEVYIICPELKQARKIYWAPKRLQGYAPKEYLAENGIQETQMRVVFNNGSSICIDGCENYEALRGIKPHLVVYDEFQKHRKEFDEEVMQPTLMGRGIGLIVCCTPPKKRSAYAVEFRQRLLEEIREGDTSRAYFEFPSWLNPSLDREELDRKKQALFKAGDETIWFREYEGRLIFGGEGSVFPHWDKRRHVYNHGVLMAALERDKSKLKWFTACDPGTSTCFAVLFGAYNPYTSQLFLLDEIYEKDRKLTSAIPMFKRILAKEHSLYPNHPPRTFKRIYDEAAAWFANEVSAHFREGMLPTSKLSRDIEQDISIIKSLMATDQTLFVSDRIQWLPWEIESYVTDEDGGYPDESDHLIDALRYAISLLNVKFVEKIDKPDAIIYRTGNIYSSNEMVRTIALKAGDDWTEDIVDASLGGEYWEWN